MLAKQLINLPFGIGVDEKIQAEILDPGQALLYVQNLRINKTGSFEKRKGYDLLEPVPAGLARRLGQRSGAPVCFDGQNINAYIAPSDQWTNAGLVSTAIAERTPVISSSVPILGYDIAYANGVFAIIYTAVFQSVNFVYMSLLDEETGTTIKPETFLTQTTGAPCVRVLSQGGTFIFLVGDAADDTIDEYTLNSTTPQANPMLVAGIITDADSMGSVGFDACLAGSSTFAVVYHSSSGATNLVVSTFVPGSPTASATNTFTAPTAPIQCVGIQVNPGDVLWVGINGPVVSMSTTIYGMAINITTLAIVSAFGVLLSSSAPVHTITIVPVDAKKATFIAGNTTDSDGTSIYWATASGLGATVTISDTGGNLFRYAIAGKGFAISKQPYLPVVVADTLQPTGLLIKLDTVRNGHIDGSAGAYPITTHLARLVNLSGLHSMTTNTVETSSGHFVTVVPQEHEADSTSLCLVKFDFAASNRWQNDELGGSLVFSAGVPSTYDGLTPTELVYVQSPTAIKVAGNSSGSFSGTYSYTAIYEWVSSTGDLVQSAPAIPVQVTVSSVANIIIQVPELKLSYKMLNSVVNINTRIVRVVVYRTTDQGTDYYRIPVTSYGTGYPYVVIGDATADATLETQALLYTQPGTPGTALAKVCPPSASCLVVHRNRVWLVGDDGITVWYSGQFIDGEQPWFSDQFTLQVPKGGPITAMASMDGILYIFKRDFIFSVTGDGPADNGSGNDLSVPEEMDVECGCIEPRSVVIAPGGIFYQSAQGLYMLSRSRSVSYVGRNVEDILRQYPVIHSACLLDRVGCIYWEVTPDELSTNSGVTIVYDYVHSQWLIDTKTIGETLNHAPGAGAVAINGKYWWVTTEGVFNREGDGFFDAGKWVTAELDTAWIKMAGLQGFQRIKQINLNIDRGDAVDDPTLGSFGIYAGLLRDYDSTQVFQEFTWTSDEINALTTAVPQLQLNPRIQKLESLHIVFRDLEPISGVNTGFGPVWIGLALEVGVKQGAFKLPVDNSK